MIHSIHYIILVEKFAKLRVKITILFYLALLLAACSQAPPQPTRATQQAALPTLIPTTALPSPTATEPSPTPQPSLPPSLTPTIIPTDTPTPTATATATNTPTATPDPYLDFTVQALAARDYGGGELEIVETLARNDEFTRYLITYPSDGLTIYGFMNVPNEGWEFPVAIVMHGYIPPDEYETIAYTTRYADALARAGYLVIHPNFRNYPPSDDGPDQFRIGLATDVLNLIAIIREQSQDPMGYLRRANRDEIHLMGHSMGGGAALRVVTINNEPYLRAAVLYGSMSGDEALNYERVQGWSGGRSGRFELGASDEMLRAISPIHHLERLQAAIGIHHSEADDVVPFAWSEELCQRLEEIDHPVECFTYWNQPHTFHGDADALFMERMIDFFDRY